MEPTTELTTVKPRVKRGPKSKRTPEIQARLIDALKSGCTRRASCGYAGISQSEFYEWLSDTAEFKEEIEQAENTAEAGFTRVIQDAAIAGDWKAAESWLKRRRREDWGDSTRQEITGPNDGPVQVQAVDYRGLVSVVAAGSEESDT